MSNRPPMRYATPTEVTNKNRRDSKWAENMSAKYSVASRTIASKMLGTARDTFALSLLAVNKRMEKTKTSAMP